MILHGACGRLKNGYYTQAGVAVGNRGFAIRNTIGEVLCLNTQGFRYVDLGCVHVAGAIAD